MTDKLDKPTLTAVEYLSNSGFVRRLVAGGQASGHRLARGGRGQTGFGGAARAEVSAMALMRSLPADGSWRRLLRPRPWQPVFGDLRRRDVTEWRRGPVALEWSGVLEFRQQSRQGHARFAPAWAAATARQRLEIMREITAPVSLCPAPTGKRRISCLYSAPDCQIKWVVFLTGIGAIIECKPLMPS